MFLIRVQLSYQGLAIFFMHSKFPCRQEAIFLRHLSSSFDISWRNQWAFSMESMWSRDAFSIVFIRDIAALVQPEWIKKNFKSAIQVLSPGLNLIEKYLHLSNRHEHNLRYHIIVFKRIIIDTVSDRNFCYYYFIRNNTKQLQSLCCLEEKLKFEWHWLWF